MTKAVSGGLVYEYSEQGNGYGIVNIQGNSVQIVSQQFNDLKQALASTSDPAGDGGYAANNSPQDCPGKSEEWDISPFSGSALPAMPSGAVQYFKSGAGKGPGLSGSGSQEDGTNSVTTASASAGAVTATYGHGSSPSGSSAATSLYSPVMDLRPFSMVAFAVFMSFGFGVYIL
jgi:1,3-beta-glucanosyltransferase GAS5